MLARALAGNPRMLLIDELLDGLPDSQLPTVITNLLASVNERTCLISTGRRDVASYCGRQIDLASDGEDQQTAEKKLKRARQDNG